MRSTLLNSKNNSNSLIIFFCSLLRDVSYLDAKNLLIKVLINTCFKIDVLINLCVQLIIKFYSNFIKIFFTIKVILRK